MKKETIAKFYLNYRLYIFPAMVALSSLFLIVFAIYPQTAKLITNQKAQGDLTNKSQFLETKVSALESYDGEDLSRKVAVALSAYPTDKDFGNVVGLLQQLVGQSGFNITSLALGNVSSQADSSSSYEIKLQITGSKNLLSILLNNLENSARLMRVNNIDVSSGSNPQIIDISLGVAVLYSSPPQSFGSIDSPIPKLSQENEELITRLAKVTSVSVSPPQQAPSLSRGKANPFE